MIRWTKLMMIFLILFSGCRKDIPEIDEDTTTLTIFSINDPHAQINNFDKIADIVTLHEAEGPVIVVCGGDIFSGNPVVDFIDNKGYPIIDLMNKTGFDVSVIGNHEYDYGLEILEDRIDQAEFEFICANVDMAGSTISQADPYVTISAGGLDVTFLGFVETSYSAGRYLPATHPLKVESISFSPVEYAIDDYTNLKTETGSDLLVVLSHLGTWKDFSIASDFPIMDAIIGGHSHAVVDTTINNVPIYQCGSYLRYLGKITLEVSNGSIVSESFELINLNSYAYSDASITSLIEDYNYVPELDEVIGYTGTYLSRGSNLGCFYTDALRTALNTDVSFQNGGGLRADIDVGDITIREIYEMDPFNNGAHIYSMRAVELKRFLGETGAGLNYSGIIIENDSEGRIIFRRESGTLISDEEVLTIGINDFIPAVYDNYFSNPTISDLTTAENIIEILREYHTLPDYSGCNRYYRY